MFNPLKMISKTTSVLGLSKDKLGYDSRGSVNSKSGIESGFLASSIE